MKFNEWITQKDNKQYKELSSKNLGMETQQDLGLIESQLDQWIDKLNGLLYDLPSETKAKLVEKVINKLRGHNG